MGYTTEFQGNFTLDKPLKEIHANYLKAFSGTRRMKRNVTIAKKFPDPLRKAVGLPIGNEGEFFVGTYNDNNFGQTHDASIVDYNNSPITQPGFWCQWVPNHDGNGKFDKIGWDGGEKFYGYIEWINYIIDNFLAPWGYKVSGEVMWRGEEFTDTGIICIKNNVVKLG